MCTLKKSLDARDPYSKNLPLPKPAIRAMKINARGKRESVAQ